jgi:hypothetical protein
MFGGNELLRRRIKPGIPDFMCEQSRWEQSLLVQRRWRAPVLFGPALDPNPTFVIIGSCESEEGRWVPEGSGQAFVGVGIPSLQI